MKLAGNNNIDKKMFIFAGEKSGDLHGSHLVNALRKQQTTFHIEGVAGPKMRNCGVRGLLKMEDFEVMGLTDVLMALPKLLRQFFAVRSHILQTNPEAVLLIDSPSFTLRLAKALRHKGYQGKIIQYISPSVWAWGNHRIQLMADSLNLLLTIYPFEDACFKNSHLNVAFVGNPLQEYIANHQYNDSWKEKVHAPADAPLIALFPGSRLGEIMRNLPVMFDAAAAILLNHPGTACGISCGHSETASTVSGLLNKYPDELRKSFLLVPKEFSYELMRDSRAAIAKSGTVTLELALHRCPTTVLYALTRLNRIYAKHILKLNLPYYCIVNILAGKPIFPEFIEKAPSKDNLVKALEELYANGPRRLEVIQSCASIADSLGDADVSKKAANAIGRLLAC
jgi:lipid-A-disaccharide synthase